MEGGALGDGMIRSLTLTTLLLSGLPIQAGAEQPSVSATCIADHPADQRRESWKSNVLKPLGIRVDGPKADGVCNIIVTVERAALSTELTTLQAHGALSRSIASEDVEKRPASYANVLTLLLTSYAVRDLYSGYPYLGATRWTVLLSPAPGDPSQAIREMFSLTFDRPMFERIDWDRLPFTEFPRAAAGFSYNLRFTLEMSREVDGSIADD